LTTPISFGVISDGNLEMEKLRQACKDLGVERDAYCKKMKDSMQKCTFFKEEMISERYKADNAISEAN
jgi:hypothetical protein